LFKISGARMSTLFRKEVTEHRADRLHGEVMLSQSLSSRVITMFLAASVATTAFFLSVATYARTETARGVLVSVGGSSKVYATRAGTVTALLVKDGDNVVAGQRLVIVQSEQPGGTGERYSVQGIESLKQQETLARERMELSTEKLESDQNWLRAALEGLTQQRAGLQSQLALQREFVASARQSFEPLAKLVKNGTFSKVEYEKRHQAFIAARQEEGRLDQQLETVLAETARAQADIERTGIDSAKEIAELKSSVQNIVQQKSRLESESGYALDAPIAGRVTAIQTAIGRAVGGPVPLMVIAPANSPVNADIYAPSRAIGFVRPGQEVRLLYDAFPYQRFGSFNAKIKTVSRAVLSQNELDAPLKIEEPVYRVTAELGSQELDAFGESVPLQPGMMLTANIILDRRSFLDWLLTPFNAIGKRNS
jgi:membrane fusion protein